MPDTKRVIHSIDITLSPRESQPVMTSDMADEFYQRVQISDLHLPQEFDQEELTNEVTSPVLVAETEGSSDVEVEGGTESEAEGSLGLTTEGSLDTDAHVETISPPNAPLLSKVVAPVARLIKQQGSKLSKMLLPDTNGKKFTAKQLKSRMDQVLSVNSVTLSKCKTAYLVARAKACDGLTVRQCLQLSYRRADGQVKKFS